MKRKYSCSVLLGYYGFPYTYWKTKLQDCSKFFIVVGVEVVERYIYVSE